MKILVTGAAGFIGGNLISSLKKNNIDFVGIDNFSPYYQEDMKQCHIDSLSLNDKVINLDICDKDALKNLINKFKPSHVVHLAGQGGVRASKFDPIPYIESNQIGFLNVLQESEKAGATKFIFASSSSVYSEGLIAPFSESDKPYAPKSLYALSKLADELMAKSLPTKNTKRIGLRFFTVYGPWGRPDMAIFRLLASSILEKEFIFTANSNLMRDFTYVDDVIRVIFELINLRDSSKSPEIYNVAGGRPHTFSEIFDILNNQNIPIRIKNAISDELDVNITHASTLKLSKSGIYVPNTSIVDGIMETWKWMKNINQAKLLQWYEYST